MVRELGRFVIAHPQICHGQPTIRGTRIMVKGILEELADGMSWDEIIAGYRGDVTHETIAEIIELAAKAFLEQAEATRPVA
jgi:uncharacterized protein (DUF433 family)